MKLWRYVVCTLGISVGAAAQQIASAPDVAALATANPIKSTEAVSIVGGTPVDFEFVDAVSSKTAKVGQRFVIRLVEPILAGSAIAVPAGALGEGEVIHAARAGAGGRAGELVLSARFIESGGVRVPLRGFRFGQSGVSRNAQAGAVNAALAGASVFVPLPPLALLIGGKDVDVPPSTRGSAKVASDIAWPSTIIQPH